MARRVSGKVPPPAPRPAAEAFPELSAREREVLKFIARGRNNQEIARELYLNPKAVRNQISNIFTKLQVVDGARAAVAHRSHPGFRR
ncbi:MAG: two component transcriptional regulator, LuxR family [Rubrobacteraceae bacterium]|nr:two component transcriptional regulator, LuxR family [Rubrobacteraceae bacterium]